MNGFLNRMIFFEEIKSGIYKIYNLEFDFENRCRVLR